MQLVWDPRARAELRDIIDYISDRNPAAADRMYELFQRYGERVAERPLLYRQGRVAGTREAIVHPNYIMVYRAETDRVTIVSILHTRQQYP